MVSDALAVPIQRCTQCVDVVVLVYAYSLLKELYYGWACWKFDCRPPRFDYQYIYFLLFMRMFLTEYERYDAILDMVFQATDPIVVPLATALRSRVVQLAPLLETTLSQVTLQSFTS